LGGSPCDIAAIGRDGPKEPIMFLHGFGSTKEDYADIALDPRFDGHPFLAYDAPGCGESILSDLSLISIPRLVDTALQLADWQCFRRVHLVGHSMGGLTALQLAIRSPERVLSFSNIEGNIAPEDCFLSRQVDLYPDEDPDVFFNNFIDRVRHSPARSSALYAASLRYKVRSGAVRPIFRSMVDLSDNGDLMARFLGLPFTRMFMYGNENRSLSYLGYFRENGIPLVEIPACGHFPMYSNPPAMWDALARFIVGGANDQR
jgi:pimeloyl-ACP methyl ester carboxylesterase